MISNTINLTEIKDDQERARMTKINQLRPGQPNVTKHIDNT